ncbi:MAG TPA: DNA translocase FtsK 4TM domain-containing protein, partial [Candidatus Atribacteria bacterium]|nr:DNA translocase FtsK 4TM domain-containing protein [Candidatus Atribacteria bacterium]
MNKKLLVVCFLSFFAIYSLLIVFSFDVGQLGELIGFYLFRFLGVGAYILPFFLGYLAYEVYCFQPALKFRVMGRIISFSLWIVVFLTLSQRAAEKAGFSFPGGDFAGIAGGFLYRHLVYYLGDTGSLLALFFVAFLAVYLGGEGKLLRQLSQGWRFLKRKGEELFSARREVPQREVPPPRTSRKVKVQEKEEFISPRPEEVLDEIFAPLELETREEIQTKKKSTSSPKKKKSTTTWALPSPQLLKVYPSRGGEKTKKEIMEEIDKLEQTLAEFNVLGKVISVQVGPTITRFEFQPAPGIKVQKITSLSNDLALAFAVAAVRIEAPIPGRSAVGIEVPNRYKEIVSLRDLIESEEFKKNESPLTIALGRDVSGRPLIWDLREAPHLLIAGATGSGKSVCINSILTSFLYRATPNDLRIGLVDPKRVELSLYSGLPHLCAPVISDARWVVRFLKWLCREMDNRYELLSEVSARNIEEYNQMVEEKEKLPYVVIVIDELADLMMTAPAEVENSLCRIAQIARAVGMHLVVATQRPS